MNLKINQHELLRGLTPSDMKHEMNVNESQTSSDKKTKYGKRKKKPKKPKKPPRIDSSEDAATGDYIDSDISI